ncbi:hypothetical protein [Paraburkholderia youngii]|uniref:hypothetical protein n=1 Tax=Paraburkholderia youngii TaxID=2782701 RepID=UPI003D21A413
MSMKLRVHAKRRAAMCWQRFLRLRTPDDETTGLWPAKRAYQARSRELLRSGQVTQDSMAFIPRAVVKASTFRRRTDEF